MAETSKTDALEKIKRLAEKFDRNIDAYKDSLNETSARVELIDPFFEALGWDVNNRAGLAHHYRDVIHEDKVKIGGQTKAPDYCFTVYGQRKFFVEAKKPAVNIREEQDPAYQARRYGWSAKLPVTILTDFEEFAVYDCRKKPAASDKTSQARVAYFTYQDYEEQFDFLWSVFSKPEMLRGGFDQYVKSAEKKRGTSDVDDDFLESLEGWRELLAKAIHKQNDFLNEDQLNFVLQKTLDRVIFLRICEDRGLEPYGQLSKAVRAGEKAVKADVYQSLFDLFKLADAKYNSGLFDLARDPFSAKLKIDPKPLQTLAVTIQQADC